jgi:hypothetical protein
METISPSVDRIGAALRALRRAHESDQPGNDPVALGAKCLHTVVAQLAEEGVPQEDLQPLSDLEARVRQFMAQTKGQGAANRRKQLPPSDLLLARGAAVIDLLIKAGADESEAAQTVMRRLMAAGVPPPKQGGDARVGDACSNGGPPFSRGSGPARRNGNIRISPARSTPSPPMSG